jgi:hypothetical protein
VIASPCFPRSRHGPPWLSMTAGATHRALICTEQAGTCLIHADSCLRAAASRSAVSGTHTGGYDGAVQVGPTQAVLATHWPVVQQNDHPGTSDHAIPADWDRRHISQVRAPAGHHAAGRATSLPPETEPARATRCRLPR